MCSTRDFSCVNGFTIQFVLRELLSSINSKLKIYKKLFFSLSFCICSFITLVQNTIVRLQHPSWFWCFSQLHASLLRRSDVSEFYFQVHFWGTFRYPVNEFYLKICLTDYARFTIREFLEPICTLRLLRLGSPKRGRKFGCEIFPETKRSKKYGSARILIMCM